MRIAGWIVAGICWWTLGAAVHLRVSILHWKRTVNLADIAECAIAGLLGPAPYNDKLENMMPACRACNIDKMDMPLEHWRKSLERKPEVLRNNYSAWRHAERFGLVAVVKTQVVFYFEQCAQESPAEAGPSRIPESGNQSVAAAPSAWLTAPASELGSESVALGVDSSAEPAGAVELLDVGLEDSTALAGASAEGLVVDAEPALPASGA